MFDIEMSEPSRAFVRCWISAMQHIDSCVQGGMQGWMKDYPGPPFLEHVSFRLGNQLYFVRLVDVEEVENFPGTLRGLSMVAGQCRGHACLMPMRRARAGSDWHPVRPGWGLVDAVTGLPIDPVACVTDALIEMTEWECNDMAVQVVRDDLSARGLEIVSWHSNPEVDPSIWFDVAPGMAEWVLVRWARYPDRLPVEPTDTMRRHAERARVRRMPGFSERGHFAAVAIRNAEQGMTPSDPVVPLWRGHALWVDYESIIPH